MGNLVKSWVLRNTKACPKTPVASNLGRTTYLSTGESSLELGEFMLSYVAFPGLGVAVMPKLCMLLPSALGTPNRPRNALANLPMPAEALPTVSHYSTLPV
jgi:hypothetical protein